MPSIDVSTDQLQYLEELGSELEDRHVGKYGIVRPRDALQYLIDHHEQGTVDGAVAGSKEAGGESDGDGEPPREAEEPAETDDTESDGGDGGDRLQAMMQLLERHDDKWEAVESEEGKYAVRLPDDSTEHVRTKDDVRALLFQHYD